jgi:uncharacterized protein DUF3854/uncharacterized protein DUF3631
MTATPLCLRYLAERGISLDTARIHGLEFDDRLSAQTIKNRLGRSLPNSVNEILWFPIHDVAGAVVYWIARPLPTIPDLKFIHPVGSNGKPFIPQSVYGLAHGKPVIITEGPVKALACLQAGCDAIGINGVWGAGVKNAKDLYTISAELYGALDWSGRKVYLALDADGAVKPDVRQACIRLFLILSRCGAEIFQLTTWDHSQGKGIDDYFVNQSQYNGQHKPDDVLRGLLAAARPFIDSLNRTALDLRLVSSELGKVQIPELLRDQLCKLLAPRLGVRAEMLREVRSRRQKTKPEPTFAAEYEPWPEPVNSEQLFDEVMGQIRKEAIINEAQQWVSALEVFLTWVHDQMDFSPILYITGPTRECGKTRLLLAIGKMARRPLKTSSINAAPLFRLSELYHPTFLIDEAQDAFKNDDFCTIMKAGHDPNDVAVRVDTNTWEVKTFDVFCPKVVAGIGRANGQIMSRSITLEMERNTAEVDTSTKATDPLFVEIRRKLARWANDVGDLSRFRLPSQAAKLRGRDNWEVYYRVASGISQYVADQLLKFIPGFSNEEEDFDTYLLTSLRKLYREHDLMEKGDHLGSEMILTALNEDKEAPWYAEHWGRESKGLTRERLSARLRHYKVKPEQHWHSDIQQDVRGYFYVHPKNAENSLKRIFDQYLSAEQ